ncbi:MAG: hypothetical protein JW959_03625 [Pirellulales bacterium]|nr:hypothetical protein [Pirellulales bacterium]
MSPAAENVLDRLDAARQKWWLFTLLSTTALAAGVSFGLLICFMAADAVLLLPAPWLSALAAVWLLVSLLLMFLVGRRLLRGQRGIEATARRMESAFPELDSDLINLVQLGNDRENRNRAFCLAAVNQAAAKIGALQLDRAAAGQSRRQRFIYCMQTPRDLIESLAALAVLIAAALVCRATLPNWGSAASRLFAPWTFVPSVGSVEIISVSPGDVDVLVGESVRIGAEIRNPPAPPVNAILFVKKANEPENPLPMTADGEHRRFALTVPSVAEAFDYRLEIGDSQTRVYSVRVRRKPVVESAEATFRYPAYIGRKDETLAIDDLNLEAPQYTEVRLRLRAATPVAKGCVELGEQQFPGRVEPDGSLSISPMPLLKNGSYVVRLWNDAGHTDPNPRVNDIRVRIDQPPTVELRGLSEPAFAAPGTTLSLSVRVGDDYGVGRAELQIKIDGTPLPQSGRGAGGKSGSSSPRPLEGEGPGTHDIVDQWTDFSPNEISAVRRHLLTLDPKIIKPGRSVFVRAAVWDRRAIEDWGVKLEPQRTVGRWHEIRVVSPDDEATAVLRRLEALRAELLGILKKQVHARTLTAEGATDGRGFMEDVRNRQIDIQKSTSALAKTVKPDDRKPLPTIRRVLGGLAAGEMIEAVKVCDELLNMGRLASAGTADRNGENADLPSAAKQLPELTTIQDRIIAELRKLLETARRAESDLLAEMEKRPGGDLPDDARDKIEQLHDKLEEFLKQQKRVIEASEELAKTPVDDFTEEQEELLEGLAAAEDDLSRFLEELRSDQSKLPEQDFSNPSTAKELVEIQTEIKMAEGALTKKTVDIAVPLEQLGHERAEELKANLEKWLPDAPDRERWSQEESLTDADKEAPMAELPEELEDLVGELMEEEEDIFDEMEDISSSAADSLDAGAGWDAADGPISNMSAKGVTGNRLPNSSEIGGRSGEGREGKSSGEMVGDEAVGKGGRRTPSRLTPDANVAGAIEDHDRDPAGGATGGGKESGQSGEGLEGPVPRSPGTRDAQRLAGRQAELRNKAEGVEVKFQVSGFHRTDLKKLIEIMAQVERDIEAGRYRNALRRRRILLEGLGAVRKNIAGDFQARRDASANLPADVRKELLGGMHDPSPEGWEELNRRYFERLTKGEDE